MEPRPRAPPIPFIRRAFVSGAVDARISRGRDKLIKILRKEGYEFDGKRV